MNWFEVTYDTSSGRRKKLIRASFWMEAVEKVEALTPEGANFSAYEIPQGMRTK